MIADELFKKAKSIPRMGTNPRLYVDDIILTRKVPVYDGKKKFDLDAIKKAHTEILNRNKVLSVSLIVKQHEREGEIICCKAKVLSEFGRKYEDNSKAFDKILFDYIDYGPDDELVLTYSFGNLPYKSCDVDQLQPYAIGPMSYNITHNGSQTMMYQNFKSTSFFAITGDLSDCNNDVSNAISQNSYYPPSFSIASRYFFDIQKNILNEERLDDVTFSNFCDIDKVFGKDVSIVVVNPTSGIFTQGKFKEIEECLYINL